MRLNKKNQVLTSFFLATLLVLSIISSSYQVSAYSYEIEYDQNGNILFDGTYYYEYDGFNQLSKVKDKDSNLLEEYFYGADGERAKKIVYSDSGETVTYYIDEFVQEENSSGVYDSVYYYAGSLVARKDSSGTYFYHTDHLGSTDVVTNSNGQVVEDADYEPFGLSVGEDRYLFTGKEKDDTGLMYYGARYYNPSFMRFTQPDTILADLYDPQQLNRYSYVRNNPQTYVDPSGNILILPLLIFAAFVAWDLYDIYKDSKNPWNYASLGSNFLGAGVISKGAKIAKFAKSSKFFGKAAKMAKGEKFFGGGKVASKLKGAEKSTKGVEKIPISKLYGHETTSAESLFRKGAPTHDSSPISVIRIGDEYMIDDGVGRTMRAINKGDKYVNARIIRDYPTIENLRWKAQFDDMARTDKLWWEKSVSKMDDSARWRKLQQNG